MQQGHSMFVQDSLFRNIGVTCGSETPNIELFFSSKTGSTLGKKHSEEKRTILELRKRSGNSLRVLPLHTKGRESKPLTIFRGGDFRNPTVVPGDRSEIMAQDIVMFITIIPYSLGFQICYLYLCFISTMPAPCLLFF